eukprot:3228621-Pleurochrysis_carterae.AAC.1
MTLPKSPQAAKASADAAWEGMVTQNPPRPRIGKGILDSYVHQLNEITFKRRPPTARGIASVQGQESIV